MRKRAFIAALAILTAGGSAQAADHSLEDVAFLTGAWRGGDTFIFEETWSAPASGVMTGMARGHQDGELRVLEYIVIAEETDGVVMRFKHFNADYSTWEKEGAAVVLPLVSVKENDITFSADPPSETVKSIRYWMPDTATLQADVVLDEDGEEGGFSLVFSRSD